MCSRGLNRGSPRWNATLADGDNRDQTCCGANWHRGSRPCSMGGHMAIADRVDVVDRKDSTIVDPDVHQVVFENEHVRVIDARAGQGWTNAIHSHPPMLFIGLGTGRQKVTYPDGRTEIVDLNPGAVVWRDDSFDHSWELLAGEVHVIMVEVKSANSSVDRSA